MVKRFKLVLNSILYHPVISIGLALEMLFIILLSLNSTNYIFKELSIVNFTKPFSNCNFICYMPTPDFNENGEIVGNHSMETREDIYSKLKGLKSVSKSCALGARGNGTNFEIRAISQNIYEHLNVSLYSGNSLINTSKNSQYINCLVSKGKYKVGDVIEVNVEEEYNSQNIVLKVVGIVNAPYFTINPFTGGEDQGFSDFFEFTSKEDLSAYNYSVIWVDYDDFEPFIPNIKLESDMRIPVLGEFLFFDDTLTKEEMIFNKRLLDKSGDTFDQYESADNTRISIYINTELPKLVLLLIICFIGLGIMIYLDNVLLRNHTNIWRVCGATEATICSIIMNMFLLLLALVNIISILLERIFISAGFVEFDIAFMKYSYCLLGIIDIIIVLLTFTTTSAFQLCIDKKE